MERASFSDMECPIARAADEVGDGWILLILREAYKGAKTFGELQEQLPINPATLTRKLVTLTSRGLLEKVRYQSKPIRERYDLTDKALDLLPVLLALGVWGNRWLAPDGEILSVVDPESAEVMAVAVVDTRTGKPLRAGKVALVPGPGATSAMRARLAGPLRLGDYRPK
jgi:DNA-binding HxlR family transcriptional regulator